MAILREWRARIRADRAEEYVAYVKATGIEAYRLTPGNLWAAVAVRTIDEDISEIVTLSIWDTLESIKAFAGENIARARYFPEDDQFLLTRPETVAHYEIDDVSAMRP